MELPLRLVDSFSNVRGLMKKPSPPSSNSEKYEDALSSCTWLVDIPVYIPLRALVVALQHCCILSTQKAQEAERKLENFKGGILPGQQVLDIATCLQRWDVEYKKMDTVELCDLVVAANFLGLKDLVRISSCCFF